MNELKPCPFCGSEVTLVYWKAAAEWFIRCPNGDCIFNNLDDNDGPERLVREWNNRAYD
jgi:ssDNA-binding Zn-finger/Zn-ribbon topoisomerase 1